MHAIQDIENLLLLLLIKHIVNSDSNQITHSPMCLTTNKNIEFSLILYMYSFTITTISSDQTISSSEP